MNDDGEARLDIRLEGPKGKGTLRVSATKSRGVWTFDELELEVDGRPERINLLRPRTAI